MKKIMIVTILCVCVMCISDTVDEDDDLYDFVQDEENEGDEIYEDLMRTDEQPETVSGSIATLQHATSTKEEGSGFEGLILTCTVD